MAQKRNIKPAIELIKHFEGLRLQAYKDTVGVWTIGYGTIALNGMPIKPGQTITEADALQALLQDLETVRCPAIERLCKVELTDNEFCALVSFCYNLGIGALAKSTLLKLLNTNASREIVANEFLKWTKAGGVKLPGLVKRRKAEKELFLRPDERRAHGRPVE